MRIQRSALRIVAGLLIVGLASSTAAEGASEPVTEGPVTEGSAVQDVAAPKATVQAVNQDADARVKRCRVKVRSAQSTSRKTFSATQILDLDFRVKLRPETSGEHILRVDLRTPKGHHYQTLTVPFSTDASLAGTTRRVEGFPRPLEVQTADTAAVDGVRVPRVDVQLPVAGTAIVHSALYGRWTAIAYLDDETASCGRRRFTITP